MCEHSTNGNVTCSTFYSSRNTCVSIIVLLCTWPKSFERSRFNISLGYSLTSMYGKTLVDNCKTLESSLSGRGTKCRLSATSLVIKSEFGIYIYKHSDKVCANKIFKTNCFWCNNYLVIINPLFSLDL